MHSAALVISELSSAKICWLILYLIFSLILLTGRLLNRCFVYYVVLVCQWAGKYKVFNVNYYFLIEVFEYILSRRSAQSAGVESVGERTAYCKASAVCPASAAGHNQGGL